MDPKTTVNTPLACEGQAAAAAQLAAYQLAAAANKTKPSCTSRSASAMGPHALVGGRSARAYYPQQIDSQMFGCLQTPASRLHEALNSTRCLLNIYYYCITGLLDYVRHCYIHIIAALSLALATNSR